MERMTTAWTIKGIVRLSSFHHSRKKCGWRSCDECDLHNFQKETVFKWAAGEFKTIFDEFGRQDL